MVVPTVLATIASIRERREGRGTAGCKGRASWEDCGPGRRFHRGTQMLTPFLHESFAGPSLDRRLRWRCEPTRWSVHSLPEGSFLRVVPEAATDFWRRTHYGFEADNGHFLFTEVSGDFVLGAHVRFRPAHQ